MDRAPFNRLAMATDLAKCAACGLSDCEHPDAVFLGIVPEPGGAPSVENSGAVPHRAGLYSETAEAMR